MSEINFQKFLTAHADIETAFKSVSKPRSVTKGHIILSQGETSQDMFFLKEGHAKVILYSEGGHEVQLAQFTSGTLFGEMAVLLKAARSSNVVAQSDCRLDIVSAKDFIALMHDFPKLSLFITQLLASRLQQTSQSLFESLAFTVPQRIYETILRRAEQSSNDKELYRLTPAPSVTSLSKNLNVSRESASRAVTKLVSRGLVKKEKAYWNILRPNFGDS